MRETGAIERREPQWCVLGVCRRARGTSRFATLRGHHLEYLRSLRAVGGAARRVSSPVRVGVEYAWPTARNRAVRIIAYLVRHQYHAARQA